MKKDIEWLQKEFDEVIEFRKQSNPSSSWGMGNNTVLKYIKEDFKDLINQLDEPEVLSQEWLDEHSNGASRSQYVWVDDLKELLVPKQEITEEQAWYFIAKKYNQEGSYWFDARNHYLKTIEKPVIPQFVAKWISVHHERFDLYPALKRLENNGLSWEDVYKWYRKNTRKFVNAYLTGKYEVEEEQKYYVQLTNNLYLKRNKHGAFGLGRLPLESDVQLTEQEIKDYDERYWPFAVKVEELEEC